PTKDSDKPSIPSEICAKACNNAWPNTANSSKNKPSKKDAVAANKKRSTSPKKTSATCANATKSWTPCAKDASKHGKTPSANTMKASFANIARIALIAFLFGSLPRLALADVWRDVQEVNRAIEAWDYPTAKQKMAPLRDAHPDHPGVLFTGGKLDFHLADYPRALEQLEAARDEVPSQAMQAMFQLLDLVKSTQEVVKDYQTYTSE